MGPKQHKNDSCLFPFGNNLPILFALMVLDDEDRKRRWEESKGGDDDLLNGANGEFNIDKDIDDADQ